MRPVIPAATHVDRVFAYVTETRQRCTRCRQGSIRYDVGSVLKLTLGPSAGDNSLVSDWYLKWCSPVQIHVDCPSGGCGCRTEHVAQSRVLTRPNVLLLHVGRGSVDPEAGVQFVAR